MDRLVLHDARVVRDWPSADRDQLLAVVHRDLHVARRNVAELTRYLDDQAAHLAACAGAGEDKLPGSFVLYQDRALLNIKNFILACPVILLSHIILQPGSL